MWAVCGEAITRSLLNRPSSRRPAVRWARSASSPVRMRRPYDARPGVSAAPDDRLTSARRARRHRGGEQLDEPAYDAAQAADGDRPVGLGLRQRPPPPEDLAQGGDGPLDAGVRLLGRPSTDREPAVVHLYDEHVALDDERQGGVQAVGPRRVEDRGQGHRERVHAHLVVVRREGLAAAPSAQGVQHRLELTAAVGQLVGARRPRRWQGDLAQHPGLLELTQALGEHVGADPAQARAQVGEPLGSEHELPGHQEGPSLPDDVERASDAAGVVVRALAGHGSRQYAQRKDFRSKRSAFRTNLTFRAVRAGSSHPPRHPSVVVEQAPGLPRVRPLFAAPSVPWFAGWRTATGGRRRRAARAPAYRQRGGGAPITAWTRETV